jgi:hypothetical protein
VKAADFCATLALNGDAMPNQGSDAAQSNPEVTPPVSKSISFEDFLASTAPGVEQDVYIFPEDPEVDNDKISVGPVNLFCPQSVCEKETFFDLQSDRSVYGPPRKALKDLFLVFRCRHCRRTQKTFAVRVARSEDDKYKARKFGEIPNFGPPLPARLIRLFQPDADLLKRGFEAETLGFGVAAMIYYRRVVENQRNLLFDALIQVAEAERMDADKILRLQKAKVDKRFSASLEEIKDAIPDRLKILDQNPIALLYDAFSEAVHLLPDEDCLQLASSTRGVLIELSEQIAALLKQKSEVEGAVKYLMNRKSEKGRQ